MGRTAAVQKHESAFSKRVLVVIDRDMTSKTPKVVWQHEIPVLEAVHGEGSIIEVNPQEMNEGYSAKVTPGMTPHNKKQDKILPPSETAGLGFLFIGDADEEYERLAAVYGVDDEGTPQVENAYGRRNERRLASMLQMPSVRDLPKLQLRQVLVDHGIDIPENATDLVEVAKAANFEFQ
jgi:hypothetical protein